MNKRRSAVAVLVSAAVVHVANADIINVPGDQPTIQAAIDAAADTDEIVVAEGTYFEAIDFIGKAITVRSSNGAEVTFIDTQQNGSVVTCDTGEGPDTVLDGFTITGGANVAGGGMNNSNSSPTVTNCTFSGNSDTDDGGEMYNSFSSPAVTNCAFIAVTGTAPSWPAELENP